MLRACKSIVTVPAVQQGEPAFHLISDETLQRSTQGSVKEDLDAAELLPRLLSGSTFA